MSWICDFPLTRESKKTETRVNYLMDINRCWPLIHSQERHQQWPRSPSCFSPHIVSLPQNQVYPSHLQFPSSHIKHVPPCLPVPSDFPYNCLFFHCWNWSARTQFSHVDSQHTYCVVSLPFATQKRLHRTSPLWYSDLQVSFGISWSFPHQSPYLQLMGEKGETVEEKQQIKQNEKQVTNKTQQFEVCYGKESMS